MRTLPARGRAEHQWFRCLGQLRRLLFIRGSRLFSETLNRFRGGRVEVRVVYGLLAVFGCGCKWLHSGC
eukprot:3407631-Pyramimonas_sp.AAC.1